MQRLRPLRCATLLVILLAGCAAPCAPSRTEAVVLPMGRGSYYLFHDGAAELCRGQDARQALVLDFPPRPTAGALDLLDAYSGVACGDQVGFLELRAGSELQWLPAASRPAWPVEAMAIRGGLCALVSTTSAAVRVVTVPDGDVVFEASPPAGMTCLRYAVPVSNERVLMLGEGSQGALFVELDRSNGAWGVSRGPQRLPEMDRLRVVTTDGERVILAGLWERAMIQPSGGGQTAQRLQQKVVISQLDLATLARSELVFQASNEPLDNIVEVVASDDFCAITLRLVNGQHRVLGYDLVKAAAPWVKTFGVPVSIVRHGPRQLAIYAAGYGAEIVSIGDT